MANTTYFIIIDDKLNIVPGTWAPLYVHVKQYDGDYTRQMKFTLYNGEEKYTIPSNTKVVVCGTKRDQTGFSYYGTYSGSTVTVPLMKQMTAVYGPVLSEIVLFDSNNNRIASASFVILVEQTALTSSIMESSNDFQTFLSYIDSAEYYSKLSQSYAIGETGIRGDENTNNSEYYSIISKSWAIGTTDLRTGENSNNSEYYSKISKSWAVGDTGLRGGEGVNNAEYYCNKSRDYAIGDVESAKYYANLARNYEISAATFIGAPVVTSTSAGMTDTSKIYVYIGNESGYTKNNWYYYDNATSTWKSGGVYQSTADDKRVFANKTAMTLATDLSAGMTVLVLGGDAYNDGCSAIYYVRSKETTDVFDDGSVVELFDKNLCAEKIQTWKHFYNVKDFGAKGDGVTNDYNALIKAAIRINKDNGGYMYFPEGEYIVTNPIHIPSNTIIFGEGRRSKVRHSPVTGNKAEKSGTFAICGDNVEVFNISIENDGPVFDGNDITGTGLITGAQDGGLGITNVSFPWDTNGDWIGYVRLAERKNVYIHDVYSDSLYPLQAEVATGTGHLRNIVYKNIYAPNGLISMMPWWGDAEFSKPGMIDSVMDNIHAKAIRVGGRFSAAPNKGCSGRGIKVSNLYCRQLNLWADGISATNIMVDATQEVPYYNLITETSAPFADAVTICGKDILVSNMTVLGSESNTTTINGINIFSGYPVTLSNVICTGFKHTNLYVPTFYENENVMHYFNNCHCYHSDRNRITGYATNSEFNPSTTYPLYQTNYNDNYFGISPGEGFNTVYSSNLTDIYKFYDHIFIDVVLAGSISIEANTVAGTFNQGLAPKKNIYGRATVYGLSGEYAGKSLIVPVTIDTNGKISFSSAASSTVVGTNTRIRIEARYQLQL